MKDVVGYEGYYLVSADGEVYSVRTGKYLSLNLKPNGYVYVKLNVGGVARTVRVHRLIAEAFVPNPDGKPYVNHINGIKSDNRADNLEWVDGRENNLHAIKVGLVPETRYIYRAIMPDGAELEREGIYAIASAAGVSVNTVSNTINRGRPGYCGIMFSKHKRATTIPRGSRAKRLEMGGDSLSS
jgi:hypothetical protein